MHDIVIAFGCQIRDGYTHREVLAHLNREATSAGTNAWTYPKKSPAFKVRLVYTKAEFAAALDIKDAVVVYDGHSRLGQGPAFGPENLPECPEKSKFPVNPWGDSFRMGYDFTDIECIDDILAHGTNPREYALPASTKGVFASRGLLGIVERAIRAGGTKCGVQHAWRRLSICFPKVATKTNCSGDATLSSRHYYRVRARQADFDTLVAVGDADLAKTKLACSVLFVNSCSSKRHFHGALRRHKKNVKSKCMFFLTAEVCSAATTLPFLKAVLAGKDVTARRGANILRRMNGMREAGAISLEE